MALTELQRSILRVLAPTRLACDSFVARQATLNTQLHAERRSHDIDLFHDTVEAMARTVAQARVLLSGAGYRVLLVREAPTFAEAVVERDSESTLIQWVHDSAYRFFPLLADDRSGAWCRRLTT